jgi:hypothetical protein
VDNTELVARILAAADQPLTIPMVAELTELEPRDVDKILWASPDRFVWQPGHKWSVAGAKSRPSGELSKVGDDARPGPLVQRAPEELRAITLSSGLVIKVSRMPLDTDAFFSVRSVGNTVQLVINSTHELFGELPMPFQDSIHDSPYKLLVEVLLESWALYEDSLAVGSARRPTEDVRLLWGRRAIEILRENE